MLFLQIGVLREELENIASKEIYMGERMPIKWLQFEKQLAHLVKDGVNFATFDQVNIFSSVLLLSSHLLYMIWIFDNACPDYSLNFLKLLFVTTVVEQEI